MNHKPQLFFIRDHTCHHTEIDAYWPGQGDRTNAQRCVTQDRTEVIGAMGLEGAGSEERKTMMLWEEE